jgi:hypothetical protein
VTAVGVAALAVGVFFLLADDEDRNPIRVKNKQLRIETDGKPWVKPGGGETWKPNHPNGKSVNAYQVSVFGANEPACATLLHSATVVVRYAFPNAGTQPRTFTFRFQQTGSKSEPVIDAPVPMTAENNTNNKKLRMTDDTQGAITEAVVGTTTCTFPTDRRVTLELCMHNCQ